MVAALGKRMFSKCVAPGLQMHPAAGTLMQNTSHKNVPHRSGGLISPDCLAPPAPPHPSKEELVRCHSQIANDTVSEQLRRWTRNPLGSARRGSNPLGVDLLPPRWEQCACLQLQCNAMESRRQFPGARSLAQSCELLSSDYLCLLEMRCEFRAESTSSSG